jgi:hypothetical protein
MRPRPEVRVRDPRCHHHAGWAGGTGRIAEYEAMIARLKRERKEYLASFGGLDESLVKSLG